MHRKKSILWSWEHWLVKGNQMVAGKAILSDALFISLTRLVKSLHDFQGKSSLSSVDHSPEHKELSCLHFHKDHLNKYFKLTNIPLQCFTWKREDVRKKTDANLSEGERCNAMWETYTCNDQCLRNTTRFHNGDYSDHTNTPFLWTL